MMQRVPLRNASAALVRALCDLRECISTTGWPIASNSAEYSAVRRAVTKKAMTCARAGAPRRPRARAPGRAAGQPSGRAL